MTAHKKIYKSEEIPYCSLEPERVCLVITFLVIAAWYLIWRLDTLNPDAMVFSWLLYGAELYGMVTVILHLFMTWRLTERVAPPPAEGHSIDVLVTTINESVDMVRRTLLASVNMEYTHQTWLLDDGNRPEMAALAEELKCRYITRPDNRDAKAGNLNNALKQSQADFIVVFDSDHAPHKNFLTNTLGYFRDPEVAFVQTPQDFYNLDSYQHRATGNNRVVWTEQSLFFRVIQKGKDYWNAAFFCGSCAVIRRNVLEEIGGFATGTVTEDLHTSLKIHKRGYKSVYHAEPLAFGLAPSSVVPFMKQRIRWGQGAMQVWRKEGIVFFARGLTIAQRLNYLASVMTYLDGWQKAILYTAPVVVLVTGLTPINAMGFEFWLHFIPYYLLVFWVFEEVGRGYGRTLFIEQYNMGRFAGFAWSTLGFFKKNMKFIVTPKTATPKQETYRFVTPQIGILLLNGIAIPLSIVFYYWYQHLDADVLTANIVWAAVNMALALSIVRYSVKMADFKRKDYRFPIPLPAKIQFDDQPARLCTIDNVSSSGCKAYGYFPQDLQQDDQIKGKILLPHGILPFTGKITSLIKGTEAGNSFIKSLGCQFEWNDLKDRDYLDLFLYGSDLQWQLNKMNEGVQTLMDRWFGYTESSSQDISMEHWSAMLFKQNTGADEKDSFGLISSPGRLQEIITFKPLINDSDLVITIFSPKDQTSFEAKLTSDETQLVSPTTALYTYTIKKLYEIES